jgi:small subunit ribosomal protein S8
MVGKTSVEMPGSKLKVAVAQVLKDEGYIEGFDATDEGGKPRLSIGLKYYLGKPVIAEISRISRPGLRRYSGSDALPSVRKGLGVAIISTSQGVMTERAARAAGVGGEVLCTVF